jgi:hypothetical protein
MRRNVPLGRSRGDLSCTDLPVVFDRPCCIAFPYAVSSFWTLHKEGVQGFGTFDTIRHLGTVIFRSLTTSLLLRVLFVTVDFS